MSESPTEQRTAGEESVAQSQPPSMEITHDNQMRGHHFKLLMRSKKVWIFIGIAAVICGAIGAAIGPAFIAAGVALAVLVGVLIVFGIADHRAEEAFFDAYAASRGMTHIGKGPIQPYTPLLRKGDRRYAEETFKGPLGDGCHGSLVFYTYEVETRDSKGNKQTSYYPFTLCHTPVPEITKHMPELLCQRQSGFKVFEGLEDSFRRKHERVTLESEEMLDRYEVFVRKDQDQVFVRRLFSPSFIVWMCETPPDKFAFELVNGNLVCYRPKHRKEAEEMDEMRAVTAAVAARLREEAASSRG